MTGSELAAALAAVQAGLPRVVKSETAEVRSDKGNYTYTYADLEDVSDAIMPLLGKNGLAFTTWPAYDGEGRIILTYELLHVSGEAKARDFPLWMLLPQRVNAQTIGGLIKIGRAHV